MPAVFRSIGLSRWFSRQPVVWVEHRPVHMRVPEHMRRRRAVGVALQMRQCDVKLAGPAFRTEKQRTAAARAGAAFRAGGRGIPAQRTDDIVDARDRSPCQTTSRTPHRARADTACSGNAATHSHVTLKRTSPQRQLPCDEGIKIFPCCIGFDHTTRACTPTYIHTARDGIPQRCPPMALATRPRIPALGQNRQSSALPAKCDVLIASKTAADRSRFPVTQVGIEGSSAARGEAPRIRGRQRLSLRNRL